MYMDLDKLFVYGFALMVISAILDEVITFIIDNGSFSFLVETNPLHFLWKIIVFAVIFGYYKIFSKNDLAMSVIIAILFVVSIFWSIASIINVILVVK